MKKNIFASIGGYLDLKLLLLITLIFSATLALPACTREVKSEERTKTELSPKLYSFGVIPSVLSITPDAVFSDKKKDFRFAAGDSVVIFQAAPNTDIYVEFSDTSNSSADTFKVYIRSTSYPPDTGHVDVLAYLKQMNVIDSGQHVYTNGLVIPGDGATVFYKFVYPYPTSVKIVRSSFYNTRSGDKVTIKAMSDPTGSIDVPGLTGLAVLKENSRSTSGFTIDNSEVSAILQNTFKRDKIIVKPFSYPLKL